MRHAVDEIRMRSAMDNRQHGTHFTPAKAAAAMEAEREAEGAPFPKQCKEAPRCLKALKMMSARSCLLVWAAATRLLFSLYDICIYVC